MVDGQSVDKAGKSMADAVTAIIGIAIMVTFLGVIVGTLSELPLTIVSIVAVALMLWGFWKDTFAPLLRRGPQKP
jgi:hypothetical protein